MAGPGGTLAGWLMDKGFESDDLAKITDALPTIFDISFAFNA